MRLKKLSYPVRSQDKDAAQQRCTQWITYYISGLHKINLSHQEIVATEKSSYLDKIAKIRGNNQDIRRDWHVAMFLKILIIQIDVFMSWMEWIIATHKIKAENMICKKSDCVSITKMGNGIINKLLNFMILC